MRVTLTSDKERKHSVNIIVREDEILLTTPAGVSIAKLYVQSGNEDDFFLCFRPEKDAGMKDAAWVPAPSIEATTERKALNDPEAALKLVSKFKRLLSDTWQVMPCPSRDANLCTTTCSDCDGKRFVRVNVNELKEFNGAGKPAETGGEILSGGAFDLIAQLMSQLGPHGL
jgi:hypothetical protein